MPKESIIVRVGQENCDIIGRDHRALQAAVDYVAALGGGTVEVGPGVYEMRNSLHLRNRVTVRGTGDETVLRKANGCRTALVEDGDYGQEEISLADPSGFAVGDGVTVFGEHPDGFHTTVATIIARLGENTFVIDRPLYDDNSKFAQTTYPVISAYHVDGVCLENLTIDGNRENNPFLGGCRGGGVYLFRSHGALLRGISVMNYNGDGISYQQCDDVTVEACTITGCSGGGLHPGSGSRRTVVRGCRSVGNRSVGMYVCWRVRDAEFADNAFLRNGLAGISIGHKDTDNVFVGNTIKENRRYGILFRDEVESLAAHRNRFEKNTIMDNGGDQDGAGVLILGETGGLEFRRNVIADSRVGDDRKQRYGILIGEKALTVEVEANEMYGHIIADVHRRASP